MHTAFHKRLFFTCPAGVEGQRLYSEASMVYTVASQDDKTHSRDRGIRRDMLRYLLLRRTAFDRS